MAILEPLDSTAKNGDTEGMGYPGGKSSDGVFQTIINQIPPHTRYIEGCLGGGAIMKIKRPAAVSLGLDTDPAALALWRGDEVPNLTLLNADVINWLASADLDQTDFVYLDPPYLMDTRRSRIPIYNCEMTPEQHMKLLDVIRGLPCMVAISGYWSEMYAANLADWRSVSFTGRTHRGPAVEWLWMNYGEPVELHDYRFLGSDYREREVFARQRRRWVGRIHRMSPAKRFAMFAAIDDYRSGTGIFSGAADRKACPTAKNGETAVPSEKAVRSHRQKRR